MDTTATMDTTDVYEVSTNQSEPSDNDDNRPDPDTVDQLLWIYISPVIFTVGILGNLLVLLVLRHFLRNSTSAARTSQSQSNCARTVTVYLGVMAIADIVFIVSGIVPEWLDAMQFVDVGEVHPAMCKAEKFVFYTSGDVAIWIICAQNLDRFVAICFPLRQNMPCVRSCLRHPVYLSLVITFVASAKNLHVVCTDPIGSSERQHGWSKGVRGGADTQHFISNFEFRRGG